MSRTESSGRPGSRAPIALGSHGPEVLTYDLVRTVLRDPRFRVPGGLGLEAQGIASGPAVGPDRQGPVRPVVAETTALGAAYAAGLAVGFWESDEDIRHNWAEDKRWEPQMDAARREKLYARWRKAVTKTLDWSTKTTDPPVNDSGKSGPHSGRARLRRRSTPYVQGAAGGGLGRARLRRRSNRCARGVVGGGFGRC
jgi:hypothetical protein